MLREEFIKLIGTKTIVDYPFFREVQIWSLEDFVYDKETDTIRHNRLDLICDVFIAKAINPRFGSKSDTTHGSLL